MNTKSKQYQKYNNLICQQNQVQISNTNSNINANPNANLSSIQSPPVQSINQKQAISRTSNNRQRTSIKDKLPKYRSSILQNLNLNIVKVDELHINQNFNYRCEKRVSNRLTKVQDYYRGQVVNNSGQDIRNSGDQTNYQNSSKFVTYDMLSQRLSQRVLQKTCSNYNVNTRKSINEQKIKYHRRNPSIQRFTDFIQLDRFQNDNITEESKCILYTNKTIQKQQQAQNLKEQANEEKEEDIESQKDSDKDKEQEQCRLQEIKKYRRKTCRMNNLGLDIDIGNKKDTKTMNNILQNLKGSTFKNIDISTESKNKTNEKCYKVIGSLVSKTKQYLKSKSSNTKNKKTNYKVQIVDKDRQLQEQQFQLVDKVGGEKYQPCRYEQIKPNKKENVSNGYNSNQRLSQLSQQSQSQLEEQDINKKSEESIFSEQNTNNISQEYRLGKDKKERKEKRSRKRNKRNKKYIKSRFSVNSIEEEDEDKANSKLIGLNQDADIDFNENTDIQNKHGKNEKRDKKKRVSIKQCYDRTRQSSKYQQGSLNQFNTNIRSLNNSNNKNKTYPQKNPKQKIKNIKKQSILDKPSRQSCQFNMKFKFFPRNSMKSKFSLMGNCHDPYNEALQSGKQDALNMNMNSNINWKKWRQQNKRQNYQKITRMQQKIIKKAQNSQNCEEIYWQTKLLEKKQKDYYELKKIYENIEKLKQCTSLIGKIKSENTEKIMDFFEDLEAKVVNYTKYVNQDKCKNIAMQQVQFQLKKICVQRDQMFLATT